MFFVYILYSQKIDKFYIGQTYDLDLRLLRHKLKTTRFTKQADDWVLKYFEEFDSRAEAVRRERCIKKMKSKKYILNLIK